jgi:hypothetical protein
MGLILLLLAGCGSKTTDEGGGDAAMAEGDPFANAAAAAGADDPARLQDLVVRGMAGVLQDARNAQYRDLRAGVGGAACGYVAPKGAPAAGFRPFVVTPDAIGVVGAAQAISFEDPDDLLADAWIRWCATPEELQRLGPTLQAAAAASAGSPAAEPADSQLPPPGFQVPVPPAPEPQPDPPPPPPQAKAKAPPPPPPQIDSFFNSVQTSE